MIHRLRKGFTTGTCASAAAKAAALFLMEGKEAKRVQVVLGNGDTADFPAERAENGDRALEGKGWWRVKKDAGDDPDVTDGVWVYGRVIFVTQEDWEERQLRGKGYFSQKATRIYLNGGPGIGIVTKDGLSCPKGHYAINPSPRSVIVQAVEDVREKAGYEGFLEVQIAVPDGVILAEKTFNPCLGIQGGISILGTTGIVEPMSEEALVATIRAELSVLAAAGERGVILTPGNYGRDFLREMEGIPDRLAVKCGNFLGEALAAALELGFCRILLVGHLGKLVKLAGGMLNTHSRYGDCRLELLAAHAALLGAGREVIQELMAAPPTVRGAEVLRKAGLLEPVMASLAEKIEALVARRAGAAVQAGTAAYLPGEGIVLATKGVPALLEYFCNKGEKQP